MRIRGAIFALVFSAGALALLAMPAFADSISLNAYSGGGVDSLGLFDFTATNWVNFPYWGGQYPGTTPTNLSYIWNQAFVLPASRVGDYLEVTRVNTLSTGGEIIINGDIYGPVDNLDLTGVPTPDPNLYKQPRIHNERMDISGPIFVDVYGSFNREYDSEDWPQCCQGHPSVDATAFGQFVQIERFHENGTPDPFPSAPEPGTSALMLLSIMIAAIRFRFTRASSALRSPLQWSTLLPESTEPRRSVRF